MTQAWEWIDMLGGGLAGAIVVLIIMLVRERNAMATKTIDVLMEREKRLEDRIDYLTSELDKVKERLYNTRGAPE